MQETKSETVMGLWTPTLSMGQGLTDPSWVETGSSAVRRVREGTWWGWARPFRSGRCPLDPDTFSRLECNAFEKL